MADIIDKIGGEHVLTLRELRDRLSEIIAEHEERGWAERNEQPVFLRVEQAKTPSGRLRPSIAFPIVRACSGSVGQRIADKSLVWTTELRTIRDHAVLVDGSFVNVKAD